MFCITVSFLGSGAGKRVFKASLPAPSVFGHPDRHTPKKALSRAGSASKSSFVSGRLQPTPSTRPHLFQRLRVILKDGVTGQVNGS